MKPEECGVCGEQVSFSQTIHVMVHTHSDEGVLDYYVCQSCYEDDLRPLFADPDGETGDAADAADPTDLDVAEP